MAGYVIAIAQDKVNILRECIKSGTYGTFLNFNMEKTPVKWTRSHFGTLTDYASMKAGDYIYFFHNRKIYGRGELINIVKDCKYFNFPKANQPGHMNYNEIKNDMLLNTASSYEKIRVVCFFKPSPFFFNEENCIDMDDVLNSNPQAFKMLRAFQDVSFIKIDDLEENALFDIFLRKNENNLKNKENIINSNYERVHNSIKQKLLKNTIDKYIFSPFKIIQQSTMLESGLELQLVKQLVSKNKNTIRVLGNHSWDYISHQVIASPFKPISYMDRIDIFGYSYISNKYKIRNKYLIIELKKDRAQKLHINQILKYIDYVNKEYACGDYSMIEAYLIANKISKNVKKYRDEEAQRFYSIGSHIAETRKWNNLKLIEYDYNEKTGEIILNKI